MLDSKVTHHLCDCFFSLSLLQKLIFAGNRNGDLVVLLVLLVEVHDRIFEQNIERQRFAFPEDLRMLLAAEPAHVVKAKH